MAFYSYLVAAHITAVVFLIGGMFAHNRIMNAILKYPLDQQTAALESLRRLDQSVTAPALLLTWTFGLGLALWGGWFPDMWLVAKLIVVIGLSVLHGVQSGQLRRMLRDKSCLLYTSSAAADPTDFERIHRDHLARLPGVSRMRSSFAIRTVARSTAFPLPEAGH